MKKTHKSGGEPIELSAFRLALANQPSSPTWNQFKRNADRTRPVKNVLRADQRGLCAYCEIKLGEGNESVEHIVPRAKDHNRELDWQNLLLVCLGDERTPPPKEFSCGHARNFANSPTVLNPLEIPAGECLFKVGNRIGDFLPDSNSCARAGIAVQFISDTIINLGLSVSRLSRARLRVIETIEEQLIKLVDSGLEFGEAERQLAEEHFMANAEWPEFFTTLRYKLGNAAEERLREISYNG